VSRMLRRIADHEQAERERRENIERALADVRLIGGRSAPADPRSLRGIPMIGGAQGAIPGTVPHRQRRLDRWSGRGHDGAA
jgi:hypothetical protein